MRAPLGTAMELDETICKRPVCQHPQCWVTMRRIEQGHPRLRPPPPTARRPPQDEGGLPVLSVSTLPPSGVLHHGSDSPHLSDRASSTVYTSAATCSMEKFFFPGVNSYREILAPSRSSGSSWKPRQAEILRPSFQDAKRDVTLVWVPNAQHRPPRKEDGEKQPKVWIKDLTLSDPQGGTRREKTNPALTINRKQKKPPSGGCPLNLTLVGSSPHTKKFIEAREVQEQPEKTWTSRRRQRDPWPDRDSVTSPSLSGIIVGNRRVVLHETREKCPAVPHTGPVYRLDNQPSAAPDDTEINLDRIRNQYYLWKKYIHRADPSHRIKPPDHRANRIQRSHKSSVPDQLGHIGLFPCDPDSALSYYKSQALETPTGSLVCDTTRSRDSEDRNSPSLAGLSQRSWSDEEPSGTPTETGDRIQQEIPGEINKEARPAKPPELDVPADEESTRPNMSCDQSESAMETTDAQENPGGATSSPQPHPPPPSPMN